MNMTYFIYVHKIQDRQNQKALKNHAYILVYIR